MKRVFLLLIAIVVVGASHSTVMAQSWGDILKGAITDYVDDATGGKATEYLMTGEWSYDSPAVRLESDNELANLAGNALVTNVESKLQTTYNFVGIKKGGHSLTLNTDDSFVMTVGKRTLTGRYTYDADTHALSLEFSSKLLKSLSGYAYIDGDRLDVAYDCTKLVNFLSALGSKVSMLNSITQLVDNYDNIYVGFAYSRN